MAQVKCFICPTMIDVGDMPCINQIVVCPSCGQSYEVIWLFPLVLTMERSKPMATPDPGTPPPDKP